MSLSLGFLNPHPELMNFLNKFLPQEVEGVIQITCLNYSKRDYCWFIDDIPGVTWKVEVVCEKNTMDECNQFKLLEKTQNFIRLFGEACDNCDVKVVYIAN